MQLDGSLTSLKPLTMQMLVEAVSKNLDPRTYIAPDKQKNLLGRFSKPDTNLPIVSNSIDMKLCALYDNNNEYLWNDEEARISVYIGVTGAGKTYQLLKHAVTGFVCYTTAADRIDELDQHFSALILALQDLYSSYSDLVVRSYVAYNLVLLWIISKLACLYVLLDNKEFTPRDFATSQIYGASTYYRECFVSCLHIAASADRQLLISIHDELVKKIRRKTKYPIGIAFDEAQIMITMFENNLFYEAKEHSNDAENMQFQGLLFAISYLCGCLKERYNWIGYAGTHPLIGDTVQSGTGRKNKITRVIDFPYYSGKEEVMKELEALIDMSGCDLDPDQVAVLTGRPRTLCYVVQVLKDDTKKSKQEVLSAAIANSYQHMVTVIAQRTVEKLKTHRYRDSILTLMLKIVIARAFGEKVLIRSKNAMMDFVHAGIFHLRAVESIDTLVTGEPLGLSVIDQVVTVFQSIWMKPESVAYKVVSIHNTTRPSEKGSVMERILGEAFKLDGVMQRLENIAISYENEDKSWISRFKFKMMGTAKELGDKMSETRTDIEILQKFIDDKIDQVLLQSNFGPNLLGLANISENGEIKKRTMWVSSKVHWTLSRSNLAQNDHMAVLKSLDMDKVLMVNITLGKRTDEKLCSKVNRGEVLVTVTWDNLNLLFQDSYVAAVVEEIKSSTPVEVSADIQRMLGVSSNTIGDAADDNDYTDKIMSESKVATNDSRTDSTSKKRKLKQISEYEKSKYHCSVWKEQAIVDLVDELIKAYNNQVITKQQFGVFIAACSDSDLQPLIELLASRLAEWRESKAEVNQSFIERAFSAASRK